MNNKNIRPYELSLWTLQDSFITVLARSGEGKLETPKCSLKNDGTQELSFSIPMYIREKGELIENPIWYSYNDGLLIENMRKLKLIFNKGENDERIFEFLITKITETHTQGTLVCEVESEGLIFHELGKVGYKISLSQADFEKEYENWWNAEVGEGKDYPTQEAKDNNMPIQNLQFWADRIFEGSDWTYEVKMDWSCFDHNRLPGKVYDDDYIGSWKDDGSGNPIPNEIITLQEKARPIEVEKSNRYNITQTLAETFGVYCRYEYEYDENYHIIGKKCIFYNNYLQDKDEKFDINYPFDASKIEREKDSVDIISKMYVVPVESEASTSGLITIADAAPNKIKEDYILNFDYLYKIGTISQEQYDTIDDYERSMFNINTELEPLTSQIIKLNDDLVSYKADKQISISSQTYDKEQMDQSNALLNALTNNTGELQKTTSNPYVGTLLSRDGTYYLKITQEGVLPDTIKIYYKAKDETGTFVLIEYTGSFTKIFDDCGNIIEITDLSYNEKQTSSKRYYLTFTYKPSLQYENIYNTFAKKLAEDEAKEKEASTKIEEIEEKLKLIEEKQETLLKKKQDITADFENMMGAALREGSWSPEDYSDYGMKYSSNGSFINGTNDKNLTFFWDNNYFDEEEDANYYTTFGADGETLEKNYYLSIDLTNYIDNIKDNLSNLSYVYSVGQETHTLTIGSELDILFYKKDNIVKPVLVLKKDSAIKGGEIVFIHSSLEDITEIEKELLFVPKDEDWLDANNYDVVYPRIEINSSLVRTSDDAIKLGIADNKLEKFYDYYLLYRDNKYYFTIKSTPMIKYNGMTEDFLLSYEISTAPLNIYLDALEVAKTNSMPQVSYTVDVSAWKESFIKTLYNKLNCVVMINDADLKFEDVQGYISEVELNLNSPWEDTIVVQNYKTKFEDLFSSIVASTEQMKVNSYSYNNAASAFTSGGILRQDVIQNTLNTVDLTYAFQSGNLTIDEVNGIWATSDNGVVAMRGGGIFCATKKDSYGNWLWNTGITPSGINASLISAGQLDTNLIKIYAGNNLRLQLNGDGLFAYRSDSVGEANFNEYVVHNADGLFLTNVNSEGEKNNRVEISWNGLILRNKNGERVFYADPETGNLIIAGGATIAKGSKIAGWTIEDNYLYSAVNGGTALIKSGRSAGEPEDEPYDMLSFSGLNGDFKVQSDGTLFARNAVIAGTITAGSFIGTTTTEEINNALKKLTLYTFNDDCFSYYNNNLDGNITIDPNWLRFQILRNSLTNTELTNSDEKAIWKFYYCIPAENEASPDAITGDNRWHEISLVNNESITFDADYLTFAVKNDIMYQEDNMRDILFFKFVNEGRARILASDGKPTDNYEEKKYEVFFTLRNIDYGTNQFLSQIQPPSYTFIGDIEKGWGQSTQFTIELKNLNPEDGKWYINNTLVLNNSEINGERIIIENTLIDENTASSIITIPSSIIEVGGQINITYQILGVSRNALCFKTKNGVDSVVTNIDSSSGTSFTNGDINTFLTAQLYFGTQLVNDGSETTQYYYVWKKDGIAMKQIALSYNESGDIVFAPTPPSDLSMFKQKTILITGNDVKTKNVFSCLIYDNETDAFNEYQIDNKIE